MAQLYDQSDDETDMEENRSKFEMVQRINHSGLLRLVTGKPDTSQIDLEVWRPKSSTDVTVGCSAPVRLCRGGKLPGEKSDTPLTSPHIQ